MRQDRSRRAFALGHRNSSYSVLDMVFGEDQCPVRVDIAAWNFAILRRIAMNLLKCYRNEDQREPASQEGRIP